MWWQSPKWRDQNRKKKKLKRYCSLFFQHVSPHMPSSGLKDYRCTKAHLISNLRITNEKSDGMTHTKHITCQVSDHISGPKPPFLWYISNQHAQQQNKRYIDKRKKNKTNFMYFNIS